MTNTKKIAASLLMAVSVLGCKKSSTTPTAGACSTECSYTFASGDVAATVASTLKGTYNLSMKYADAASPFPDGTKAKFTIDDNKLIVEIDGKPCITLKNPKNTGLGSNEIRFVDNCDKNITYDVSQTPTGSLNEINISTLGYTWLGQFNDR